MTTDEFYTVGDGPGKMLVKRTSREHEAVARAEAAEADNVRLCEQVAQLTRERDNARISWATGMALTREVKRLRRQVATLEAVRDDYASRHRDATGALVAVSEQRKAAEADAAACRAERARYSDMMTEKLAAAEAEVERLQKWLHDEGHELQACGHPRWAHWSESTRDDDGNRTEVEGCLMCDESAKDRTEIERLRKLLADCQRDYWALMEKALWEGVA